MGASLSAAFLSSSAWSNKPWDEPHGVKCFPNRTVSDAMGKAHPCQGVRLLSNGLVSLHHPLGMPCILSGEFRWRTAFSAHSSGNARNVLSCSRVRR